MLIDKTTTRPANASDILGFFGKGAPRTIRARALDVGGEVVGIAGYYVSDGVAVVFSDIRKGIPKMTIWREALSLMNSLKLPAVCEGSPESARFLKRLGWSQVDDGYLFTHAAKEETLND